MRFWLAASIGLFAGLSGCNELHADGGSSRRAPGDFLAGRTLKPYTLSNEYIPVGSYIRLQYSQGDQWHVYASDLPNGLGDIPKSIVELVPYTSYDPPLKAVAISQAPVYSRLGALVSKHYERSLLKPNDPGLKHVNAGDELTISGRQGDVYDVVDDSYSGRFNRGLLSVGSVRITSGDPIVSGTDYFVPEPPKPVTGPGVSADEAPLFYMERQTPFGSPYPRGTFFREKEAGGCGVEHAPVPADKICVYGKLASKGLDDSFLLDKSDVQEVDPTPLLRPHKVVVTERGASILQIPDKIGPINPADMLNTRWVDADTPLIVVGFYGEYLRVQSDNGDWSGYVYRGNVSGDINPSLLDYVSSIYIVAFFALLAAVPVAWFSIVFIKRAPERAAKRRAAEQLAELWSQIKRRFPDYDIFYVPDRVRTILGVDENNRVPAFHEDYFDRWKQMIERYPEPPQDEEERERRDKEFWQRYANHYTTTNAAGKTSLKPKQEILDYFTAWEKWVFRDYYAATGIINKTISEASTRIILAYDDADKMETFGDNLSLSNTLKRQAVEKTGDAYDRHNRETVPAHLEKWGGWFFFHIQEAFRRQHNADVNYGPQTPTSSGRHTDQDGLSYKPNV